MTGVDIFRLFQFETDMAYTAYISSGPEADVWFRKGMIVAIQHIYEKQLKDQQAFDEINYLIATDAVFPMNNNQIYINQLLIANVTNVGTTITLTTELSHNLIVGDAITTTGIAGFTTNNPNGTWTVIAPITATTLTYTATLAPTGAATINKGYLTSPKIMSDYWHYLDYGSARFTHPTLFTVTASTNSNPIKITLNKRSYLRSGDQVVIAGITGNTNVNGTRFLKQLQETQYFLYSDAGLTTPVVGNGTQSGIGTVSQVYNSTIKFKRSQEKGQVYGEPTVQDPYFQESKILIKILPTSDVCDQLTLDYIIKPTVFISTANATIDLSDHYPEFFQHRIISETAKLLSFALRDGQLTQGESILIQENP